MRDAFGGRVKRPTQAKPACVGTRHGGRAPSKVALRGGPERSAREDKRKRPALRRAARVVERGTRLDVRELPLLPRREKCFLLTSPFIEPAFYRTRPLLKV